MGPGVPVVGGLIDHVAATVEQAQAAVVGATGGQWWDGADVEFLAELVDQVRGTARRALADGLDAYC
ncbi:hypothetical protein ACPSM1_06220 [Micromonospora chersina]|uniref:hypothetical protein n=1 Tax=Micromonospora chersina TaxID=47854 RepID=UPI003CC21DD3